ncbi:hypothetical protein BDV12DRAFT_172178 [Aspergillus spectabilis]
MGRKSRMTTAEEVLQCALDASNDTKEYFGMDLSLLIYKDRAARCKSVQKISSVPSTEHPLDKKVCRLFFARGLAIQEERSLGIKSRGRSQTVLNPNYTGGGRDILRQQGLAGATNELKQGRKLFRIEKGVERPGISFVLSPAYSKLQHLPLHEERRLIELLNAGMFPELLILANDLSPKLHLYQSWYDGNQAPFEV